MQTIFPYLQTFGAMTGILLHLLYGNTVCFLYLHSLLESTVLAGLYIHIPFCKQKCAYCDFHKSADGVRKAEMPDALCREMEYRRGTSAGNDINGVPKVPEKLDTIYMGGGTPSLFAPEVLQSLLDKAAGLWDCAGLKEVTLEANPEDLTDDYIAQLAKTGFNRLSIGIQSFDEGLLRLMNRRHSAQRAKDSVRSAQKAGFGNITIDLIFGIPGMTQAQWERSLDEAVGLGIQHISAYHLTIEPGTAFGRMAEEGRIAAIPETESERQYETLRRRLGDAGFEHYEISNFARPGFRAVHNSSYWSGEPYLGIGPSAHSYDGERTRSWVVADNEAYLAGVGTDAVYGSETLSDRDLYNEFVMTSLRRADGLDLALLERKFGPEIKEYFLASAERFLQGNELFRNGEVLFIPPAKFMTSDHIISSIFAL